jgi:hypothetical protein
VWEAVQSEYRVLARPLGRSIAQASDADAARHGWGSSGCHGRHRCDRSAGFGLAAHERVMGAMLAELGLHRGKEITIEDGGLARKDFALEGDLADIEPIVQEMGERVKGIPPMVRREF